MWVTPRSSARWIVRIDSVSSRAPSLVYVPAIVMAPSPMRETSRPARCAVFMKVTPSREVQAERYEPCNPPRERRRSHCWKVYRQPTPGPTGRSYGGEVDNRDEIKDFLRTRRARLTPEDAGLTAFGSNRRVPGLKRGEVADLAGVSVEYYAQLERGNLAGVSESVLDSLGRALQLDEAERTHLADLARAAGPATRQRRKPAPGQIRPGVQRLLDLIGDAVPVIVNNGRLDLVA